MFFCDGLEVKRESLGCPSWRSQMTKVQKITLSPSRDIPFNKLVLSQSNVRRVKAGVSIEQLAESIAQRVDRGLSAADRYGRAHYRSQGLGRVGRECSCHRRAELAPDAAFAALTEGRAVLDLAEGLQLRRVRVMGTYRIELSGFTGTMRDRLRTYGLFGEINSWKLRMFVTTDADGAEVLDRYPIERIAEREAA